MASYTPNPHIQPPFPFPVPLRELPKLIERIKHDNEILKEMEVPKDLDKELDGEAIRQEVLARMIKLGYDREASEAAVKELKLNEEYDPSLYPEYKPGTGMMKWPKAKTEAPAPLPTEFRNTKLRALPAYAKNWRNLPSNFFVNYRAKYIATGSGKPVYHLMILAGVVGYAIEYPHLRDHQARHKYH